MCVVENPCRLCTHETGRCVGCHATCSKYIEYKNWREDELAKMRSAKQHKVLVESYKCSRIGYKKLEKSAYKYR